LATIYGQEEIDRLSLAKTARDKILNNYQEIVGVPCIFDIFDKQGLKSALEDIMKYGTGLGNSQNRNNIKDFLIQTNNILCRL